MQVLTVPRRAGPVSVPAPVVENTPPKLLARSSSPGPEAAPAVKSQPEAVNAAAPAPDAGLRGPCLLPCCPLPKRWRKLSGRQKRGEVLRALGRAARRCAIRLKL